MAGISKTPKEDLTGKPYNRWTVTGYAGYNRRHFWHVQCVCGQKGTVGEYQLINRLSKSCGCLAADTNRERNITHGETARNKRSPEFRSYNLAKNQCTNPQHENYSKFGAKGVQFNFDSFEEFLNEVGRKPGKQYVLTRIDKNKVL